MELVPEKRYALVDDLQKLAISELGALKLYARNLHVPANKVVKGFVLHTSNLSNARREDVWLDR